MTTENNMITMRSIPMAKTPINTANCKDETEFNITRWNSPLNLGEQRYSDGNVERSPRSAECSD